MTRPIHRLDPNEPTADLELDLDRADRTGEPEVVYAAGKTPAQVRNAMLELAATGIRPVLATRANPKHAAALPQAVHDPTSGLLRLGDPATFTGSGTVAVVCAGTSDLAVAREASGTLEAFGLPHQLHVDVGVAGLHRILERAPNLQMAQVVVVVAGMEGALTSVVAGLVDSPVVAVPTSVGYGATFDGLAALLGMLSACAPGVSVVNIDNGFGAAVVARRILAAKEE